MSKKIFNLTITTAVATAIASCGPSRSYDDTYWDDGSTYFADRDTAVCVDRKTNRRIPDEECNRRSGGYASWYYIGRNGAIPYYDDPVRGGTYSKPTGSTVYRAPKSTAVTKSVAVSRGGFGSSYRSSGFSASS